jgi:hypothetical protein
MAQETYTAALAVLLVVIKSGAGRVGVRERAQYRFYPYFSAKPPYQTPQTTVPHGQCSGRSCVPYARRLLRPKNVASTASELLEGQISCIADHQHSKACPYSNSRSRPATRSFLYEQLETHQSGTTRQVSTALACFETGQGS